MESPHTRRSFVKRISASLAGISLPAGARALYAGAGNSADTLALLGGTPVRSKGFPQIWPIIDEREEKAPAKALKSRNWCCLRGNAVYDFEKMFAEAMETVGPREYHCLREVDLCQGDEIPDIRCLASSSLTGAFDRGMFLLSVEGMQRWRGRGYRIADAP